MEEDGVLSIEKAFGDLCDPRSRTPTYDLTEMLMVALCAVLCGTDNWVAIQLWGEEKLDWLRRHIPHWVLDVAFGEDQCRVRVD